MDRLYYVSQVDKYVTCSRDGSFRWGTSKGGMEQRAGVIYVGFCVTSSEASVCAREQWPTVICKSCVLAASYPSNRRLCTQAASYRPPGPAARLWNGADLKHARTVANGGSWITDCTYMPLSRRMVFTSMDRAVSTYDMNR